MPQLNILPVNVTQNTEKKDASASANSNTSNDEFSQYIDRHLSKNKQVDNTDKTRDVRSSAGNGNSQAEKAHYSKQGETDITQSDAVEDKTNSEANASEETLVPKVAASGKKDQIETTSADKKALTESEQLMSFLTKADNTLVDKSANTADNESSDKPLTAEQKAHKEAQVLEKSNASVDGSSSQAKSKVNEQTTAETTEVDKATAKDQRLVSTESKANKNESTNSETATVSAKSISGSSSDTNKQNSTEIASVDKENSAQKDIPVAEKNTSVRGESTAKTSAEVAVENANIDKAIKAQQATDQSMATKTVGNDSSAAIEEETALTAEQKATKQLNAEQAQITNPKANQETSSKEATQKDEVAANTEKAVVVEKQKPNAEPQSDTKNQVKPDIVNTAGNAAASTEKQADASKDVAQEKSTKLAEPQSAKEATTPNSDAGQRNETVKTSEVASVKKTDSVNNQSASNTSDASKAQAKQDEKAQLSAAYTEQKSSVEKDDEILVDEKPVSGVKRDATASQFIDVSSRATQTPQHIIDQQSADMLSPKGVSEIVQTQKTNTQLHQETISMFRKDFNEAVKDKVMLMISQKLQQFNITLDPPELGNMQVRVNLQGEQAAVNFVVQSQQTKDALEQNMHKLRELLAEQGVDVGDASVDQQSQQSANDESSSTGNDSNTNGKSDNMAEANDVVAHTLSAKMVDSSTTRVDYYAKELRKTENLN